MIRCILGDFNTCDPLEAAEGLLSAQTLLSNVFGNGKLQKKNERIDDDDDDDDEVDGAFREIGSPRQTNLWCL